MEVRIVLSATEAVAFGAGHAVGERAARAAYDRIDSLDAILSDWRAGSELRRLEAGQRDQWMIVSVELATVLALALEVSRATDGAFDPTIGPLTRLWRESARTGRPIADTRRAAAQRRVDYRALEVDVARRRVRLRRDSMAFDLGAIAKGFIVDEALATLRQAGVPAALVEAGGDLAVFGTPIGTSGWRIAVPRAQGDTVLVLSDGAVSTSGDDVQRIVHADGGTESHVFVPRSGRGLSDGSTIVLLGSRAAVTDALATALTLVPAASAGELAAQFDVRVITRQALSNGGRSSLRR